MSEKHEFNPTDTGDSLHEYMGSVDNVPIPSPEILNYLLRQETLEFKKLALHILTEITIVEVVMRAVEKKSKNRIPNDTIILDKSTTMDIVIAHHAPRPLAVAAKQGRASEFFNEYMKTHDDTDLAVHQAKAGGLPDEVVVGMEEIDIKRGFPKQTIGPDNPDRPGTIDWNVALGQIASWLIADTIVTMDYRFEDLISRHAGNPNSVKKISREKFLEMKEWGEERLTELCKFLDIQYADFYSWLKAQIHSGIPDDEARVQSDSLIRELFDRESKDGEYLPISPAYQYLARLIGKIEPPTTVNVGGNTLLVPNQQRAKIERVFARPGRFISLLKSRGIIKESDTGYVSANT